MIELDVVCPVYKGYAHLEALIESIKKQEKVTINKIVFALTNSKDDEMEMIVDFVKQNNIDYFIVEKEDFSHSLTREKAIREYCTSNIVVLLSQDVTLTNNDVFYNLVESINSGETVYNYSRQICTKRTIEKYIRKKNYPKNSYIVSKDDVEKMQIMAFFASDACSALNRDVFISLNGYGGYNVMMNEDQLYSKIILDAGYKKKYCADSIVEHSHKYTLKQIKQRYYDTGKFYSSIKIFDDYKKTNSGLKLAFYVLGQALIHFNIPVLFRWLPDMSARYFGMKKGKKEGKKQV